MGFFDASPPPPPPEPPPEPPRKEWMGPPEGWLGGFVPARLLLARSASTCVTLGQMEAFPAGVALELRIVSRLPTRGLGLGEGSMRFGVGYGDGRKWEGLRHSWPRLSDPSPPGIVVWPQGGGGNGNSFSHQYWLWPLPPPGPVTFALDWPEAGIAETTAELDGAVIRTAAAEAVQLWQPLTPEERRAALRAGFEGRSSSHIVFALGKDEGSEGDKK